MLRFDTKFPRSSILVMYASLISCEPNASMDSGID